jgi:hypothetical protein
MVKAAFLSFAKKCGVSQHGLHGSHHCWQCFEGFGSPGCLCGMHHICQTKCKNPLLVNVPNHCCCSLTIKLDLVLYALFEVSDSSSHLFSDEQFWTVLAGISSQSHYHRLLHARNDWLWSPQNNQGSVLSSTVTCTNLFSYEVLKKCLILQTSLSCNWNVLKLSFNAEEKHWFPWNINCTLLQGTAVDL